MPSANYQVTGMTCEHCVRAVTAELVIGGMTCTSCAARWRRS